MARKRKKEVQKEARFVIGQRVRVRPGVVDPDWPDLPLGGWAGKVDSWSESAEEDYDGFIVEVIWSKETLEQMPPIYRVRSQREGLLAERMNLREDELLPDDGSPVVIEQPSQIVPRELDLDDEEDRVRAALGLTSRDDPCPRPNWRSLAKYADYLSARLSFPFRGRMLAAWEATLADDEYVLVLRLLPTFDREHGLRCEVRRVSRKLMPDELNRSFTVPLTIVLVSDEPSRALVRDYAFWFDEG